MDCWRTFSWKSGCPHDIYGALFNDEIQAQDAICAVPYPCDTGPQAAIPNQVTTCSEDHVPPVITIGK